MTIIPVQNFDDLETAMTMVIGGPEKILRAPSIVPAMFMQHWLSQRPEFPRTAHVLDEMGIASEAVYSPLAGDGVVFAFASVSPHQPPLILWDRDGLDHIQPLRPHQVPEPLRDAAKTAFITLAEKARTYADLHARALKTCRRFELN